MSNTYTPNTKLAMPAIGDTGWSVPVNGNATALDALAPVGHLAVTTKEVPSASLNVAVAMGWFVQPNGVTTQYAGSASFAITASSTVVLYLDGTNSWALASAAAYPATPHIRLATVVAGATSITSIADNRKCFVACGAWADGMNITLGTATGTQIGTAATQKLGFFGHTPAVQPTMGAATAGTSYTANEQAMLNAVYSAVRALGLGS
jgi:hypothetical protein